MSTNLDLLMNLDPLELTRDSPELELLIKAYRQQRANAESGIKPKKEKGPGVSLDTVMAKLTASVEQPTVKRRV